MDDRVHSRLAAGFASSIIILFTILFADCISEYIAAPPDTRIPPYGKSEKRTTNGAVRIVRSSFECRKFASPEVFLPRRFSVHVLIFEVRRLSVSSINSHAAINAAMKRYDNP